MYIYIESNCQQGKYGSNEGFLACMFCSKENLEILT